MPLSRTTTAFLIAPLTTVPVLALAGSVIAMPGENLHAVFERAFDSSFYLSFFGLPIAYATEALLGLPLYRALAARNAITWGTILSSGTALGTLVMPIVGLLTFGPMSPRDAAFTAAIGAAMGLASSIVFAAIALPAANDRATT